MPVAGAKPKPQGQAVTRNKQVHDWVEVIDQPFHGGHRLPPRQPDGSKWPAQTLRWWRGISTMPHCVLWTAVDWLFAEHTARLVAAFDRDPSRMSVAKEIRDRERIMGTTVAYRRDIRVRYVDAPVESGENVVSLDDYRDL